MNPAPGSTYLAQFKRDYNKTNECLVVPASGPANIKFYPELGIIKTDIHFRDVQDVQKGDIDMMVFPKGHFGEGL